MGNRREVGRVSDDESPRFVPASDLDRAREPVWCDLCGRAHTDRAEALRCCGDRVHSEEGADGD